MYRISKTFHAEAAHVLRDTQTPGCLRLHGHSYKIEFIFEAEELNPKTGMIVDFTVVSKWIKSNIIEHIDHQLMVPSVLDIGETALTQCNEEVLYLNPQPTAELIAYHCYEETIKEFPMLKKVRVWETESSYAEFEGE